MVQAVRAEKLHTAGLCNDTTYAMTETQTATEMHLVHEHVFRITSKSLFKCFHLASLSSTADYHISSTQN